MAWWSEGESIYYTLCTQIESRFFNAGKSNTYYYTLWPLNPTQRVQTSGIDAFACSKKREKKLRLPHLHILITKGSDFFQFPLLFCNWCGEWQNDDTQFECINLIAIAINGKLINASLPWRGFRFQCTLSCHEYCEARKISPRSTSSGGSAFSFNGLCLALISLLNSTHSAQSKHSRIQSNYPRLYVERVYLQLLKHRSSLSHLACKLFETGVEKLFLCDKRSSFLISPLSLRQIKSRGNKCSARGSTQIFRRQQPANWRGSCWIV